MLLKKIKVIFFTCLLMILFITLQAEAQEIDRMETSEEEPEQVIRLEEIVIELEPFKIFTFPRAEYDLPPIDFVGVYLQEFNRPSAWLFMLRKDDTTPGILDFSGIFAKERE
ncbi:hypothetical protein ISS30_08920 [bacterium]|nr:hypothetical protein [bacterium]